MLNRAFFSLQSNWLPTAIALANLALNAVLDAALYRVGVWGIPLATSLVNVVGVVLLVVFLRRRVGDVDLGRVTDAIVRITIASAVLGAVAFAVWYPLDQALGRSTGAQIASLGAALAVGGAVYLGACRVLRVRELGALRMIVSRGDSL